MSDEGVEIAVQLTSGLTDKLNEMEKKELSERLLSLSAEVFSADGVIYEDLESILESFRERGAKKGAQKEVFKGTSAREEHSSFISGDQLIENMAQIAYEAHGAWSHGYLDGISREKIGELEALLAAWFDENTKQIRFFTIEGVTKVTVTI